MGQTRSTFLLESCMEDDSLGNVNVDGWIILNCILKSEVMYGHGRD